MYECADYRLHIKTVEDSLKSMVQDYPHLFSESELTQINNQLEQVSRVLQKIDTGDMTVLNSSEMSSPIGNYHKLSSIGFETKEKQDDYLNTCIQTFEIENNCAAYANRIWESELTDISTYNKSEEFKFLVHALPPLVYDKKELNNHLLRNQNFLSTSLISNKQLGTYQNRKFGLIYKTKGIVAASSQNINSDEVHNKENYIEGSWDKEQLLADGFDSYYALKLSKLMTPKQIENENVRESVEGIGQMLDNNIHNEIELLPEKSTPAAIFCITMGDRLYSKDYERAAKIAKTLGLPLIEIDESKCRERCGLEPLPQDDFRNDEKVRINQLRSADVSDRFLRSQLNNFRKNVDQKFDPKELRRNKELADQEYKVYRKLLYKLREIGEVDGNPDKKTLKRAFKSLTQEELHTSRSGKGVQLLSNFIKKLIPGRALYKKDDSNVSSKDNGLGEVEGRDTDKGRKEFLDSLKVPSASKQTSYPKHSINSPKHSINKEERSSPEH